MSLRIGTPTPRHTLAGLGLDSLGDWPLRRWLAATVAAVMAALAIGIPTGIVHTGFFTRMTPVTWWDYPVWVLSAVLVGLTAGTYVRGSDAGDFGRDRRGRTAGATLLSAFAVGCPICNKLVVAALGVSGALTYFAPLQPLLGLIGVGLLAAGLAVRLRFARACPAPVLISRPASDR